MAATAGNDKNAAVEEKISPEVASSNPQSNGHFSGGGAGRDSRSYGSHGGQGGSGSGGYDRGGYSSQQDRPKAGPMEVTVEHNIEKAMRVLKRKLIKEGLFKELKARRYYEKPSERKKRKDKESKKKLRKEEARAKKNPVLFS